MQPVVLPALLEAVWLAVNQRYPGRAVAWQVDASATGLLTDPDLLAQALGAIVDNAWKFTATQANAAVAVQVLSTPGGVRMVLRDNGVGFSTTQPERLGLPFVRLHSAQQFDGVGLGLALARKCVQRLGGNIQWQATPGQGCTATLDLPT